MDSTIQVVRGNERSNDQLGLEAIFRGLVLELWYRWLVLHCKVFSRCFPMAAASCTPRSGSRLRCPRQVARKKFPQGLLTPDDRQWFSAADVEALSAALENFYSSIGQYNART